MSDRTEWGKVGIDIWEFIVRVMPDKEHPEECPAVPNVVSTFRYPHIVDFSYSPSSSPVGENLPIDDMTVTVLIDDNAEPEEEGGSTHRDIVPGNWTVGGRCYMTMKHGSGAYKAITPQNSMRVTKYERLRDNVYRIYAMTPMAALDSMKCTPLMAMNDRMPIYETDVGEIANVNNVIASTHVIDANGSAAGGVLKHLYVIDKSSKSGEDILDGAYFPEQSVRERLSWILFITGLSIRDGWWKSYEDGGGGYSLLYQPFVIEDPYEPAEPVQIGNTYYMPTASKSDLVTAINIEVFSFDERMPSRTEEYVEMGNRIFVQEKETLTFVNPNARLKTPDDLFRDTYTDMDNVVTVSGITAITHRNVAEVAERLMSYYFSRSEVNASVLDPENRLQVGQQVTVFGSEERLYVGYLESYSMTLGRTIRKDLHIVGAEEVDALFVKLYYKASVGGTEDMTVATNIYAFAKGARYFIRTRPINMPILGTRYVFVPDLDVVSGDELTHHLEVDVPCHVAAIYAPELGDREGKSARLHIIDSDYATMDGDALYLYDKDRVVDDDESTD